MQIYLAHARSQRSFPLALLLVITFACAPTVLAQPALSGIPASPNDGGGSFDPRTYSYQYDDGIADTHLRLTGGGEFCWIHRFDAVPGQESIVSISTAWGTGPTNGATARMFVWDDPNDDGSPVDAILLRQQNITVQNSNSNTLNEYFLDSPVVVSGVFFVGVSVVAAASEFPASMDRSTPYVAGRAWYDGATTPPFDPTSLAGAADVGSTGFPGYWLMRARGESVGSGITYQGQLKQNGNAVTGLADLRFELFDQPTGGTQVGITSTHPNTNVTSGLFSVVLLEFGSSVFTGGPRWLQTSVAVPPGSAYQTLSPRQSITPAPYAHRAYTASAIAWTDVTGVPAGLGSSLSGPGGSPANAALVNAIGNVGIGTTTPANHLHVTAGSNLDGIRLSGSTTGPLSPALHFYDGTIQRGTLGLAEAAGTLSSSALAGDIVLRANTGNLYLQSGTGAANLSIKSNGSVGIGTTTPDALMHVFGGSAGAITANVNSSAVFERGSANYLSILTPDANEHGIAFGSPANATHGSIYYFNSLGMGFRTGGTTRLMIDASGAVGIGTTAPESALHVMDGSAGSITASSSASAVLERSGVNYLNLLAPAGSEQGLLFGDPVAGSGAAGLIYDHDHANTPNSLQLVTGVRAVTVTNNGRVGIGTTSPDAPLHVLKTSAGAVTANSNSVLVVEGAWISILNPDNVQGGILFGNPTNNASAQIVFNSSGSGNALSFKTGGSNTRMSIDAAGNVNVVGMLSKGGGAFKIDHPLDPENKYLYHSFVESPDMKNVYDGVVITDAAGYATIRLPDWFEALNRDFRYQLTVIDDTDAAEFISAKVVRKVANHQFTVRTSTPNVEVSWQVTGIRQDAFANAKRVPLEVDKEPQNRGRYLHPAAFGKPAEVGIETSVTEPP